MMNKLQKKMWYVDISVSIYLYICAYTYNEYYSAIKKKILPFVTTWIDTEGITLSEKVRYCMISLIRET